jgi:TPR repeat protein
MAQTQAARRGNDSEPGSRAAHRRPWLWVAVVVVLVLALLLLVTPVDEEPTRTSAALPDGKSTTLPIDREAADALQRPGDAARRLVGRIRSGVEPYDLDAVATQAADYLADGRLADAHLLYFFAAREGHTPSALALGTMFDPAYFDSAKSLWDHPDPEQALKWYLVAAESGDPQASTRLEALRAWVEERAEAGDESARRLQLGWR